MPIPTAELDTIRQEIDRDHGRIPSTPVAFTDKPVIERAMDGAEADVLARTNAEATECKAKATDTDGVAEELATSRTGAMLKCAVAFQNLLTHCQWNAVDGTTCSLIAKCNEAVTLLVEATAPSTTPADITHDLYVQFNALSRKDQREFVECLKDTNPGAFEFLEDRAMDRLVEGGAVRVDD